MADRYPEIGTERQERTNQDEVFGCATGCITFPIVIITWLLSTIFGIEHNK